MKRELIELTNELRVAQDIGFLTRFNRRGLEGHYVQGYVLEVGPEWVLVEQVNADIQLNGYTVLRLGDITSVESPAPYWEFVEAALPLKNMVVGKERPAIGLGSLREILVSAGEAFPLLTVFIEEEDPDVCFVGTVVKVQFDDVEMRHISPGAEWDRETGVLEFGEITRIDFGGEYERTLFLVAGEPEG